MCIYVYLCASTVHICNQITVREIAIQQTFIERPLYARYSKRTEEDSESGDERDIEAFMVAFELRFFLVTQAAHVLSDLGTFT